jgi:hypothetical protein
MKTADSTLTTLMLVYGGASLLHFVHNAVYLQEYPNLPAWLTSGVVLGAWLLVAASGIAGYLLYRKGSARDSRSRALQLAGLAVIAVYATFGLDGLDHYTRAPFAAHTFMMNLTILLEASSAGVLLFFVARAGLAVFAVRPRTPR